MPTGYTDVLYEGEQTFDQFVLTCARAFGAMITMRDEPLSAPIPDQLEPSAYHSEGLAKANARLAELETLTLPECARKARQGYAAWETQRRAAESEALARLARYEAMRSAVLSWTPPTGDHTGLRDFMVEQLDTSIKHDGPFNWGDGPPKEGIAWHEAEIARALSDIAYHAKELAAERERATERTAWLRALRQSLAVAR